MGTKDFAVNRSRPQFAFLLLLIELLSMKLPPDGKEKMPLSVHICEPMFTADDAALVAHFGISLLENLCGRYNVSHPLPVLGSTSSHSDSTLSSDNSTTLFWMPHCPKELYATVLESNWSAQNLSNIIVIGNSFESITSLVSETEKLRLGRIFASLKVAHVSMLPEYSDDPYIFNNTALHLFNERSEEFMSESSEFWKVSEEERLALSSAFSSPSTPL